MGEEAPMSDRADQAHGAAPRSPAPEVRRLGALVGLWGSEGHIVGDPPVPITGTDVYERLPGGFFLVHHVDFVIGEEPVRAIDIIGEHDPATDAILGGRTTTSAT
jgi:hypothetical protein